MDLFEYYLMSGALLLLLSVLASKATGRLGIPSLLVFLAIGMLAGSEGIGGFHFDNELYSQVIGIVALSYILFSGGLDTRFRDIKPVLTHGFLLSTLGVLITCLLTGGIAYLFLGFGIWESFLLGAIVSSTDAAAVFTVLRAKSVSLKGNLKSLLELESGSNDPMAVILTISILHIMTTDSFNAGNTVLSFFLQMIIGGLIGFFSGKGIGFCLNKLKLEFDGLYPVITVAFVVFVYGITQKLNGNGFLAVYLAGLFLGNENFIHKKSIVLFHDGISWIMQIAMFLVLGLLVFPSKLLDVIDIGLIVSAALIFFARPIAVFITLHFTSYSVKEKLFVSWVGLRGSVPIILATYPLVFGVSQANHIFNLVFFIVITSVLLQGTTIPAFAKLLKVDAPFKNKFRYPIEYVPSGDVKSEMLEYEVLPHSYAVGKSIIELSLPTEAFIVIIQRQGNIIVPKGGTHLESGDTMLILTDNETHKIVQDIFCKKEELQAVRI